MDNIDMIVVVCLNGYSSSSRRRGLQLGYVVRKELQDKEYVMFEKKSLLFLSHARRARKFIQRHESDKNVLLMCGKSLGGRNIVRFVANNLGPLQYKRILLLTIDPCWPTWRDLSPNLSEETLYLHRYVDRAINIRVVPRHDRQQCGARLSGRNVDNWTVLGSTHKLIVEHPMVGGALYELLREETG